MSDQLERVHQGTITEEEQTITLTGLCNLCGHSRDEVIELVNEGILEPAGRSIQEWRFSYVAVEKTRKVNRLKRDFDLNLPGVGLVLDLLERIEALEHMLKNRDL